MGMISNLHFAADEQNNRATKKLVKQQAEAAASAEERDVQVLEHLAYQSQVLAEIRDLLAEQRAGA